MKNNKKMDNLIESSLKKNLDQVYFSDEMENNVLQKTVKKISYLSKLQGLLDYEFEIPVSYAAVFGVFIISLFSYHITGYFPGPEEMSAYHLKWVLIDYEGVL